MFETKAIFSHGENQFKAQDCVVEKVIRLSSQEFDRFSGDMLVSQDFIKDNMKLMFEDEDGRQHCLLVVGEGRRDGILVNASGCDYAERSALLPNAQDLLLLQRYPALAELNKKLSDIVDYVATLKGQRYVIDMEYVQERFEIDLLTGSPLSNPFSGISTLMDTVFSMLDKRPEITEHEVDGNDLIIYSDKHSAIQAFADISDSSVTLEEMYAYGYTSDRMIPLGKERALELFNDGYEIFMLYEDNKEDEVMDAEDFDTFAGLYGVENPEWEDPEKEPPFQVFILNRELYDKGETIGEWLTLPADANALGSLLDRIGIDKPRESAFIISAVRMPFEDYIGGFVSKNDGIDALNMLAVCYENNAFDVEKLKDALSAGQPRVRKGAAALVNRLNPDMASGEHKIVDAALDGLRKKTPEQDVGGKHTLSEKIKAGRHQTSKKHKGSNEPKHKKRKGGPDL